MSDTRVMTPEEAVAALDAITLRDPEVAHIEADSVLFKFMPEEVRDAYNRVCDRAGDWWYA